MAELYCKRKTSPTKPASTTAASDAAMNSCRLRLRSKSRQGSRLMRGMLVEAPQSKTTGRQQRGRVFLDVLIFGARADFHLPEWITALGRNADAACNHFSRTGNICAATTDQNLLGLLARRTGS